MEQVNLIRRTLVKEELMVVCQHFLQSHPLVAEVAVEVLHQVLLKSFQAYQVVLVAVEVAVEMALEPLENQEAVELETILL